jgi:hypothetical protein
VRLSALFLKSVVPVGVFLLLTFVVLYFLPGTHGATPACLSVLLCKIEIVT